MAVRSFLLFALAIAPAILNGASKETDAQLYAAVERTDVKAVSALLNSGASVKRTHGQSKWTPLHQAAKTGNQEIAALLVERGADVNFKAIDDVRPLHVAAENGNLEIARFLLSHGAEIEARLKSRGLTPLDVALKFEKPEIVMLLGDQGAYVNTSGVIRLNWKLKSVALTEWLLKRDKDGTTRSLIKILERAFNQPNFELLQAALKSSDVSTVDSLLKAGVDPNGQELSTRFNLEITSDGYVASEVDDFSGWSALGVAVSRGNVKLVEMLLLAKANPNMPMITRTSEKKLEELFASVATDNSPLHPVDFAVAWAKAHAQGRTVKITDTPGLQMESAKGKTTLRVTGNPGVSDLIKSRYLGEGNKPAKWMQELEEHQFSTPLMLAKEAQRLDIVDLLIRFGATEK